MAPSRLVTLTFATILATAALAVVGLHVTRAGQDALMRSFHLRPAHPAEFTIVQALPTMYVAQNRVWVSDGPLDWAEVEADDTGASFRPHYPASAVTGSPRQMRRTPCPRYAAIESRLRGRTFRTHVRVDPTDDGIRLRPEETSSIPGCPS